MDSSRGLTIVAIPSEEDYVWRLSSEKVPHLTLLFLGNQPANVPHIAEYLMHAADTTLTEFGLDVARRGTLGEQDADVLFFSNNFTKKLVEFRSHLLTDPHIRSAYDSTEQFPSWIPHLTMGYPDKPAKKDTREYPGIRWVNFDRVALWVGDYTGPEFVLNDNDALEVSMSDTTQFRDQDLDSVLAHFGIKGMKWGVRRSKAQIASDDHTNAKAAASKVRKHGTKSLSNKELKDLIERMSLEKQYKSIAPPSVAHRILGGGARFAGSVLASVGRTQATRIANEVAAQQLARAFSGRRSSRSATSGLSIV